VIVWHAAGQLPSHVFGPLLPFTTVGWTGVDLFFALSGFLITSLILKEETSPQGFSIARFYMRRALRILPPFYLVLGIDLLLVGVYPFYLAVGSRMGSPLELVSLASYWSNYFYSYWGASSPPALRVFWSLCVEEHFYLVWPLFLVAIRNPRWRVLTAVVACLGFLLLRMTSNSPLGAVQALSHFRMDSILWGALGALAFREVTCGSRVMRRLRLVGLLLLVLTMFLTGYLSAAPGREAHATGLTVIAIAYTMLVVEVAASPRSILTRILETAPLRRLGKVSYGMYLLHLQVLFFVISVLAEHRIVASRASFLLVLGMTTLVTYIVAATMYRFYEAPFLALKARFGGRSMVRDGALSSARKASSP
jgi:peptidoglycan/LPS O-acetylase OafA/YrhL